MIAEGKKCVRCRKDLDTFGFHKEAFCYEEELLAEGIAINDADAICDECANEIVQEKAS